MSSQQQANEASSSARGILKQMSLRAKVTLLLLVLSLTPLLVSGLVTINRAIEHGKKSEQLHFARSAQDSANAFADVFRQVSNDLQRVARRFPAKNFDFTALRQEINQQNGLRPTLEQWRDAPFFSLIGDDYSSFVLAFPDGQVFYSHPFRNVRESVQLARYPQFAGILDRSGFAAGPLPELTGSERPIVLATTPLIDRTAKQIGTLGAIVDSHRLDGIAERMFRGNGAIGDLGQILLMSPSQSIVAHNGPTQRLKASAVTAPEPGTSVTSEIRIDDVDYLIVRTYVGQTRWSVIAMAPLKHVYRFIYSLIRLLIVTTLLTLLLVLFFADYLARVMLRPIRELERGAEMIGSGAFDYRIELQTHNQDELGAVAQAFNAMGESLLKSRKELNAYSRSLETANEELDAMVYAITHDLKRSLRGIESYSSFLNDDYADRLGSEGLEMLSSIRTNVDQINQLADDLTALVESERTKADNTLFDLQNTLEQARLNVLEKQPGEVLICGGLPHILGDEARLKMVFDNIIDNGLKFNRHAVACVEISCHDEGNFWRIDFTDNGIGIDPTYRERIFELFFRIEAAAAFSGNGTGLNIALRIVEDHRGRIEVHDAEGGGTRVSMHLPKDGSRLTVPGFRLSDAQQRALE